jgi:hypothetical protein
MCRQPDAEMVFTADGSVRRVDACMRSLVQFLNDKGVQTFDSCCGHGESWGHITIRVEDEERARALGFRVCRDVGVSRPAYPFTKDLDGEVNIILPPILMEAVA